MKRSEGNYNKQENNSGYKGNEPGFWDNLKAIFSDDRKPEKREYLHDSQPSSQPQSTELQAEVTENVYEAFVFNTPNEAEEARKEEPIEETIQLVSPNTNDDDTEAPLSCIVSEPEHDYIDFYTETSETEIYSRTFRSAESTDINDSNNIGFYIETSGLDSYTLIPDEEPDGDYTTMPTTSDDTEGAGSNTDGNTNTMLLKRLLFGIGIYVLFVVINMLCMIPVFFERESSTDTRQKQYKREWRAEQRQKLEQEEEKFNTLEIGDNVSITYHMKLNENQSDKDVRSISLTSGNGFKTVKGPLYEYTNKNHIIDDEKVWVHDIKFLFTLQANNEGTYNLPNAEVILGKDTFNMKPHSVNTPYSSYYNNAKFKIYPKGYFIRLERQQAEAKKQARIRKNQADFRQYYDEKTKSVNISRIGYIAEGSFKGYTSLRKVIIQKDLKAINDEAFANCPNLETVLLSTTLNNLGDSVFKNSNNISEVSIPNNAKYHFFNHLSHCKKINTIYLLTPEYFKMPKSIQKASFLFSECKLYVADSKVYHYRNDPDWSRFGQILPLSQSRWYDENGWWKE